MTGKLETFVRGVAFRDVDLPVKQVADVLGAAIRDRETVFRGDAEANRALVKLAALAVAFWREAGEVLAGRFDLDLREEAILDAVVSYLEREGDPT